MDETLASLVFCFNEFHMCSKAGNTKKLCCIFLEKVLQRPLLSSSGTLWEMHSNGKGHALWTICWKWKKKQTQTKKPNQKLQKTPIKTTTQTNPLQQKYGSHCTWVWIQTAKQNPANCVTQAGIQMLILVWLLGQMHQVRHTDPCLSRKGWRSQMRVMNLPRVGFASWREEWAHRRSQPRI